MATLFPWLAKISSNGGGGGSDTLVTTFDLAEWNSASSNTLKPLGLIFAKGDIPADSIIKIKRGETDIAAQISDASIWHSDSSVKAPMLVLRDSDFSTDETRSYDVYASSGSYPAASSKTLADVLAAITDGDFTCNFSSLTQTDSGGTTTRGSGAAFASLTTHAAVSTRVTQLIAGHIMSRWWVWGIAKDGADGSGAEDAHLKINWEVDAYFDASDNIVKVTVMPIVVQDWYAEANKKRLNYTLTLKLGSTTLETFAGVEHHYRGQWAFGRSDDDNNHAQPHCVLGAHDTLTYKPNKEYWVKSGLMPPLDITWTPAAQIGAIHTTMDPFSAQGHRAQIDGTGGYQGRGLIPRSDVCAFLRQTASDVRIARVDALAGLSCGYHYRSSASRTRPSESADVANTIPTLQLSNNLGAGATDTWEAVGLPTAIEVSQHTSTPVGGYVAHEGGDGPWTLSSDSSHAVNFNYFMWLYERREYNLQSLLDHTINLVAQVRANNFGTRPQLTGVFYNLVRWGTTGVSSTQWASIPALLAGGERNIGWGHGIIGAMAAALPDDRIERHFIDDLLDHWSNYLAQSDPLMPAAAVAIGLLNNDATYGLLSPWMHGIKSLGCAFAAIHCERAGFTWHADYAGNFSASICADNKWRTLSYRGTVFAKTTDYNSSTNLIASIGFVTDLSINATTDVCTIAGMRINDGDLIYPARYTDFGQTADTAFPSPMAEGSPLYVRDATPGASSSTFKLAATVGGEAIDFSVTETQRVIWRPQADDTTALGAGFDYRYALIHAEALALQNFRGHTGCTNQITDDMLTFIAAADDQGTDDFAQRITV